MIQGFIVLTVTMQGWRMLAWHPDEVCCALDRKLPEAVPLVRHGIHSTFAGIP